MIYYWRNVIDIFDTCCIESTECGDTWIHDCITSPEGCKKDIVKRSFFELN